jgi:hypothetical protein
MDRFGGTCAGASSLERAGRSKVKTVYLAVAVGLQDEGKWPSLGVQHSVSVAPVKLRLQQ